MIWKAFLSLALALTAAVAAPVEARERAFPPSAAIQAMLDQRIAGKPGLGIVLVTYGSGQPRRIYTAGESGRAGLPLNGETLFEIGSITKTLPLRCSPTWSGAERSGWMIR